jgi:DNA-binding transcriptional ArsR family regulator
LTYTTTGLNTIAAKKIKILKHGEEIGGSRDWLVGEDALERRIIEILSRVYRMTLRELATELDMRIDSLRLALRKLEGEGLVVVEMEKGSGRNRATRRSDRTGRYTFVRYLGYKPERADPDDIMYG